MVESAIHRAFSHGLSCEDRKFGDHPWHEHHLIVLEAANTAARELVRQVLSHIIPNPATVVVGNVVAHLNQ